MKKILLILLCAPFIGFTQSNIVVSVIDYPYPKESNIGVFTFPKQEELLKKEHNKYKDSILNVDEPDLYDYTLREEISKKYFNIDEILKVYIYNYNSDIICTARYVKTVYVNEVMNGPNYYHVFQPDKIIKDNTKMESSYFISNSAPKNNNIVIKEYNNTNLDNILIRDYIRRGMKYEISHYELRDGDHKTIYSRVTISDRDNDFFKSYIIETKGGESNVLLTVSDCIWEAFPTKIFINKKPVFVGESGCWESYPATWVVGEIRGTRR